MSPDQGGHTSFPVFGLMPKSYQDFTEFKTRDIVLLASESTADLCDEAPHWSFVVDVTVENSKTAPPGTGSSKIRGRGRWSCRRCGSIRARARNTLAATTARAGRATGCTRARRTSSNPYYGRLTFLAYFTGGVRAWDIREPQASGRGAFYVPESNALTEPAGYMTNNLEVDNRGCIIAVDRNGAGMDILELHGKAKEIGLGKGKGCSGSHRDDDDD